LLLLVVCTLATDAPALRVLVVCGEHAREHATVRVCEWLTRDNCTHLPPNTLVVPNANPAGAAIARTRDPCWRGNAAGVDLNRNWPPVCNDSLAPSRFSAQEARRSYAGPAPLSEPETRALHRLIGDFRPHILVQVHAGTEALLLPYHCSASMAPPRNYAAQVAVARWWRAVTLPAERRVWLGPAARDLYPARGTLCDYAQHSMGVLMCLTVELYAGNASAREPHSCRELFGSYSAPSDAQLQSEALWARGFFGRGLALLQRDAAQILDALR
jgi:hypothetical protein